MRSECSVFILRQGQAVMLVEVTHYSNLISLLCAFQCTISSLVWHAYFRYTFYVLSEVYGVWRRTSEFMGCSVTAPEFRQSSIICDTIEVAKRIPI
jgi:hypothetical protein